MQIYSTTVLDMKLSKCKYYLCISWFIFLQQINLFTITIAKQFHLDNVFLALLDIYWKIFA